MAFPRLRASVSSLLSVPPVELGRQHLSCPTGRGVRQDASVTVLYRHTTGNPQLLRRWVSYVKGRHTSRSTLHVQHELSGTSLHGTAFTSKPVTLVALYYVKMTHARQACIIVSFLHGERRPQDGVHHCCEGVLCCGRPSILGRARERVRLRPHTSVRPRNPSKELILWSIDLLRAARSSHPLRCQRPAKGTASPIDILLRMT